MHPDAGKEPEYRPGFTKLVDSLVFFSEYDPELADGLKWLDREAQKRDITFYEMVLNVLNEHYFRKDSKALNGGGFNAYDHKKGN